MIVPGVNVLNLAMGFIASQPVTLFRFVANVTQANGVDLPTYAAGVVLPRASCQAVNGQAKVNLGLNWEDDVVNLFTSAVIKPVDRVGGGAGGDVFAYGGKYYHVQGRSDWFQQDGWTEALAIRVKNLTPAQILP